MARNHPPLVVLYFSVFLPDLPLGTVGGGTGLPAQKDAFNILKSLQNPALSVEEKSQLVNAGFERMQKSPNQAYETYESKITQQTCETIASLHATTDAKQKLHAKNWLSDYIAQLNNLQIK